MAELPIETQIFLMKELLLLAFSAFFIFAFTMLLLLALKKLEKIRKKKAGIFLVFQHIFLHKEKDSYYRMIIWLIRVALVLFVLFVFIFWP